MKKNTIIILSILVVGLSITLFISLNSKKENITNTNSLKYFVIHFETNGGNKIDDMKIECGKEIEKLPTPTKNNALFGHWMDKNETPILDKALLSCDDITLYAKWQ